jgi:hypothetical protein
VAPFGDGCLITDGGDHRLKLVHKDGTVQTLAGSADGEPGFADGDGLSAAKFAAPRSLVQNPDGYVTICRPRFGRIGPIRHLPSGHGVEAQVLV